MQIIVLECHTNAKEGIKITFQEFWTNDTVEGVAKETDLVLAEVFSL